MPEVAPVATIVLAIVDIANWVFSGIPYAIDGFEMNPGGRRSHLIAFGPSHVLSAILHKGGDSWC